MKNKVAKLIEIEWENLQWLQGDLKEISKENIEKIKNSFRENGFVQPFFVWKESENNYWILDGHHRIKVLRELKAEGVEVPAQLPAIEIEAETREAAAKLVLIYSSSYAQITDEGLKKFVDDFELDLSVLNEEADLIGVDLEGLMIDLKHDNLTDEDLNEVPPLPKEPQSRLGDIFLLDGKHRVMCGDSTKKEDVDKLMDGRKADMFYSDPPYNIGLDYGNGISTKNKYSTSNIVNDSKTDKNYYEFLYKILRNGDEFTKKNSHLFTWCDENYIYFVQKIYREININNKRVNLWIKNSFYPQPNIAFNKIYEPCVYGIKGEPYLNNKYLYFTEILNKEIEGKKIQEKILSLINLWIEKREDTSKYLHPTQKPVNLTFRPIERCTKYGSLILDFFLGSGTTLIAAEQTGRVCYGMELDPYYIDVILRRYKNLYPDAEIKCLNRKIDFGKLFEDAE